MRRSRIALAAAVAVLVASLGLAACGSNDSPALDIPSSTTTSTTAMPYGG